MGREITLGAAGTTFLKNSELTNGQEIKGRYVGGIEGKFGNAYRLAQPDGSTIGVNASGMLKRKMEQVALGSEVTLTYLGKEPIEGGEFKGTMAHQFKVVVDSEPAAAPQAATGTSGLPF